MKSRYYRSGEVLDCCTTSVTKLTSVTYRVRNVAKAWAASLLAGRVTVRFYGAGLSALRRTYSHPSPAPKGLQCAFTVSVIRRSDGFLSVTTSRPNFFVNRAQA